MEKLGYNYPLFNSSFKMLSEFNQRIVYDKVLKSSYKKRLATLFVMFLLLIGCFVIYHFMN